MSFAPAHRPPRREKVFGDGRPRPLDREAKVRILHVARALSRRTAKGKAYGAITAKALAVLTALLFGFHNAASGVCFPSYEKIAEKAGCARSTVAEALKALEAAGLLTWVNRIARVRERCADLFGAMGTRIRVIRISNGYAFRDPKGEAERGGSSKSEKPTGTSNQESLPLPSPELGEAIERLEALFKARSKRPEPGGDAVASPITITRA